MSRLLRDVRILVLDTETTGVDPLADCIVELGALEIIAGTPGQALHTHINPGIPIPPEASRVHGIDDEIVADAPMFADLADRFAARFAQYDLICGYNALGYDVPLVNSEFERIGHAYRIDPARVVDPLVFARCWLRSMPSRKLEAVCAHYAITLDNAHSALADVQATATLLLAMVDGGQIPAQVDYALEFQALRAREQAEDRERWGHWLSRDPWRPERIDVACGKHCGTPLSEVDAGWLRWASGLADLHGGAREAFATELSLRTLVA